MTRSESGLGSPVRDAAVVADVLRVIRLSPWKIMPAVAASLGVALLEGVTIGLLVPLTRGLMGMDYSFLREGRWFAACGSLLPPAATTNMALFLLLTGGVFLAFVLKNALQYAGNAYMAEVVRGAADALRRRLFEEYLSFGKAFFDSASTGHLQSVLIAYPERLATRMLDFQQFITHCFTLAAYSVLMFSISWRLTAVCLCVFPLLNYSLGRMIAKIRGHSSEFVTRQQAMAKRASNALSCMPLVQAYDAGSAEAAAFSEESARVAALEAAMDRKLMLIQPLQETIVFSLLLCLIVGVAAYATRSGRWEFAGVLVFFYIIRRAATSFSIIGHMRAALASISGPMQELLGLLSPEGKARVPGGARAFEALRSGVEFRRLYFSYAPEKPVLKGLDLRLEKGKVTAVVGTSGGGKTTIASLLCRQYDVPPASIFIDGTDIRDFTLSSLRTRIALVSQEVHMLNGTLRENITYGVSRAGESEIASAVLQAGLEECVSKLPQGLETDVGERGFQLSGGERQRVSIARAILKGADILVFDEATSALDSVTERAIQDAIEKMSRGRTSLVIAHRLSTVRRADVIAVIEDGRVVEQGGLDALLAAGGRFRKYWEEQRFI